MPTWPGFLVAACLLAAGCGSPRPTTSLDTPAATDRAPAVVSTTSTPETRIGTDSPSSLAEMDALIPVVDVRTGPAQTPAPYFGAQDPSGGAAAPAAGFSPESVDQRFCWEIDVINARPLPIDELEEVVVAGEYFAAIRPFAPADAAPHLDVLIEWTATIVARGSFSEVDEVDAGPVASALAALNALVDDRCLGRS